jgi:hypothetical protein
LILYVNGDSHSAGAEAVNSHAFANDDINYRHLGRAPHPDNLKSSYGYLLAQKLGMDFHCDAESAASNNRILRTTREYLNTNTSPDLIVIGWTTWEREEFSHDGVYYQINGAGIARDWPKEVVDYYKKWLDYVNLNSKSQYWHDTIYKFHKELLDKDIPHLFFSAFSTFRHDFIAPVEWNDCYLDPYVNNGCYYNWLQDRGFLPNNQNTFHHGADAHSAWAEHLYYYLTKTKSESIMVK